MSRLLAPDFPCGSRVEPQAFMLVWHSVSALLQALMQARNLSESINVHEWVIDRHDVDLARFLEVGAVDVARDVGR